SGQSVGPDAIGCCILLSGPSNYKPLGSPTTAFPQSGRPGEPAPCGPLRRDSTCVRVCMPPAFSDTSPSSLLCSGGLLVQTWPYPAGSATTQFGMSAEGSCARADRSFPEADVAISAVLIPTSCRRGVLTVSSGSVLPGGG